VLCAEDDESIAHLLKRLLEHAGHRVECVEGGLEALDRIVSDLTAFDLLVTDHQMPGLSGLGLVSKLRDTAFCGIIIVHSSALPESQAAAYRALAVDFILTKPVQAGELLAIVQRVADGHLRGM